MSSQQLESAKQRVYAYIQDLAQTGLTNVTGAARYACEAFQALLWDRVAAHQNDVIEALDIIIGSNEFVSEKGLQFINRCYYTICNPWHYRYERVPDLERLIGQLKQLPEPKALNRLTLSLRRRMYDFKNSPYTKCLLRQLRLGGYEGYRDDERQEIGIIGDLLPNYFYLYRSTTRTPDIEDLEKQDFNDDANQSGIGQKQLFKLRETYQSLSRFSETRFNPTVLSYEEFQSAWQRYHPNRENGFRSKSQQFVNSIKPEMALQANQLLINDYLLQPIQEVQSWGIQRKLQYDIQGVWDSFELDVPMLKSIVILSFERALNALFLPNFTVQSVQKFKALVQNIGVVKITNILLNLVLGCPMVRFSLEKRLGYLYHCFENSMKETESWLVNFFEHINVALVMNAKQLIYL